MKTRILGLALIFLNILSKSWQQKTSPCPGILRFTEQKDTADTWYGTLNFYTSVDLHGIYLDVVFDNRVDAFSTELSGVTTNDHREFHIPHNNYKLEANDNFNLKFNVRYSNPRHVPAIIEVRLNGQKICSSGNGQRAGLPRDDTDRVSYGIQPIPVDSWNDDTQTRSTPRSTTRTTTRSGNSFNSYTTVKPNVILKTSTAKDSRTNPGNVQTGTNNNGRDHNGGRQTTTDIYENRRTTFGTTTARNEYFDGDLTYLQNGRDTSTHHILSVNEKEICGTIAPKPNPLVVSGEITHRGQFPWHAALYISTLGQLKYTCGGSLISKNVVITAAHCVVSKRTARPINTSNLLIYMGKYNLEKWSGTEQDAKVSQITIHPDYDAEKFFADIAILKLRDSIEISNYVRPVCLWNLDTDLRAVIGKSGHVPGFGYNAEGLVSEELSFVQMPVVAHETCIWSNSDFFSKVTSDKSFCAGFKNGTSVCNGDSGGGMVFKYSNKWYLRGIVSIGPALQNHFTCDPNQYVIFTDVAKFLDWIKRIT